MSSYDNQIKMDECYEVSEYDNSASCELFDIKDIPNFLSACDETFTPSGLNVNMTSLSALMLLSQSNEKTTNDALNQEYSKRLSLAYERLHNVPKILKQEFAPYIQILDISNNEFDNLFFLKDFKKLTSLICDHNNITSKSEAPYMPNLELLWLNHCKIHELYPWAQKLSQSCPNLKYLSLMGNLAAPSYLNGGNFYDHLQYRAYIISLFPKLIHLDDRAVNAYQRQEAERIYKKPLVDRIIPNKPAHYFPEYFRTISGRLNNILTSTPQFALAKQKNTIV